MAEIKLSGLFRKFCPVCQDKTFWDWFNWNDKFLGCMGCGYRDERK